MASVVVISIIAAFVLTIMVLRSWVRNRNLIDLFCPRCGKLMEPSTFTMMMKKPVTPLSPLYRKKTKMYLPAKRVCPECSFVKYVK